MQSRRRTVPVIVAENLGFIGGAFDSFAEGAAPASGRCSVAHLSSYCGTSKLVRDAANDVKCRAGSFDAATREFLLLLMAEVERHLDNIDGHLRIFINSAAAVGLDVPVDVPIPPEAWDRHVPAIIADQVRGQTTPPPPLIADAREIAAELSPKLLSAADRIRAFNGVMAQVDDVEHKRQRAKERLAAALRSFCEGQAGVIHFSTSLIDVNDPAAMKLNHAMVYHVSVGGGCSHYQTFDAHKAGESRAIVGLCRYLAARSDWTWVLWREDEKYGTKWVHARAAELGIVPSKQAGLPDAAAIIDLNQQLQDIHGKDYAPHPRMAKCFAANNITSENLLSPEGAAKAWADGQFGRLIESTRQKVKGIQTVLQLAAEGTLIVQGAAGITTTNSTVGMEAKQQDELPAARTWTDPQTGKDYTFDTDHQYEVWQLLAKNPRPVSMMHLLESVRRWRESGSGEDAVRSFLKTLRAWWKSKDRPDIANCIKTRGTAVQFAPPGS